MLKNLNPEMRIDAEYYRAEILSHIDILDKKKNETLDKLADFIVGPFGSTVKVEQYVDKSKYRYIRNKDVVDFVINDDEPALIPETVYIPLKQFHIKENDLLITVVGTLGKAAIAQKKDLKSIFSCKSTLLRARSVNPYYLLTYLNSVTGQLFCLRGKRGAIQEGLNLFDLKEIKVYLPNQQFQVYIEKLIKKSFSLLKKSQNLYHQAQHTLLSELGLTDWHPKHRLSFVKNYSNAQQAERIDAEYFQPKYDEIVNAIKTYKGDWDTLDNLVKIKKSIEPGSDAYQESGVPFVRVSNLSKHEITNNNQQYISEELYQDLIKYQPKQNEILLSKDATPGIAFHLKDKPNRMVPSGGILRLTVRNRERPSEEYLTLVLNSTLVQQQILKDAGGSIIKHWRLDQVKNTLIPILGKEKQKEIKSKIEVSFDCRKKSKLLLEIAKQGVEMAIEQNEAMAKEWIKMQIQNLDINLNDEE
jgi:restriction endonuclease S subunit